MPILHRAYSFAPARFYARLEQKILVGEAIRLDALLAWAKEIVAREAETTVQALRDMRYDPDWLDTSSQEAAWPTCWYMIALSNELTPAPSLSNRSTHSWLVLETVLPQVGWHKDQVKQLIHGQRLRTLVTLSGNSLFANEFTGINQFGGWLDLDEIKGLHTCLLAVQTEQLASRLPDSLAQLAALCSQDPVDMLDKAHADGIEMLETAISRNQALFIVLD